MCMGRTVFVNRPIRSNTTAIQRCVLSVCHSEGPSYLYNIFKFLKMWTPMVCGRRDRNISKYWGQGWRHGRLGLDEDVGFSWSVDVCLVLLDHVTQPPSFSFLTAIGSISQCANKEKERVSITGIIIVFRRFELNNPVYHCRLWCL